MSEHAATLRRGVRLLVYLGGPAADVPGGVGVTDLARATGMDKSQASRTLQVLCEFGLADRDPTSGRFRLGWGLFVLASAAGDRRLRQLAPGALEELSAGTGESAYLSIRQRNEVLTLFSAHPPRVIQAVNWTGQRTTITNTSAGRALLFDHDADAMAGLLAAGDFAASTPAGPTNVAELAERVASARRAGVAVVEEEFEPGLMGLAAPVRDWTGGIVAAVNLSGPVFRTRGRKPALAAAVRATATTLSSALGWLEDGPPMVSDPTAVRSGPTPRAGRGGKVSA